MISNDSLIRYFAPGSPIETPEGPPDLGRPYFSPEPRSSFFRGVTVGLAVATPMWAWVILASIR
jgi:hypothetical protein